MIESTQIYTEFEMEKLVDKWAPNISESDEEDEEFSEEEEEVEEDVEESSDVAENDDNYSSNKSNDLNRRRMYEQGLCDELFSKRSDVSSS